MAETQQSTSGGAAVAAEVLAKPKGLKARRVAVILGGVASGCCGARVVPEPGRHGTGGIAAHPARRNPAA